MKYLLVIPMSCYSWLFVRYFAASFLEVGRGQNQSKMPLDVKIAGSVTVLSLIILLFYLVFCVLL